MLDIDKIHIISVKLYLKFANLSLASLAKGNHGIVTMHKEAICEEVMH